MPALPLRSTIRKLGSLPCNAAIVELLVRETEPANGQSSLDRNAIEKEDDLRIGRRLECPERLFEETFADEVFLCILLGHRVDILLFPVHGSGLAIDMNDTGCTGHNIKIFLHKTSSAEQLDSCHLHGCAKHWNPGMPTNLTQKAVFFQPSRLCRPGATRNL